MAPGKPEASVADPNAVTHESGANGFSELLDGTETGLVTYLGLNIYGFIMPEEDVHLRMLFLRKKNPFLDVNETQFFYTTVLWAVEKGITAGVDATHFAPTQSCSRAQVVAFLYRAMGSPKVSAESSPFTDVVAGEWYELPVLWAVENGITAGLSANTFGVNTVCNRAQVVTFLYRTYVN